MYKVLCLVIIKFGIILAILNQEYPKLSFLAFTASDTSSYVDPATGNFSSIEQSRMPGYPIFIKLCHKIAGENLLYDMVIIMQLFFSVLSIIALYALGKQFLGEKWAFFLAIVYAAYPYISFYDLRILTESMTLSFIIFAIYFAIGQPSKSPYLNWSLSSLFLTISISVKPIGFLVLIWLVFYLLLSKIHFKSKLRMLGFLLSFFVLFETFWIPFNFNRHHKVVFFTKTPLYSWYYEHFVTYAGHLMATFGGGHDDYLLNPEVENVPIHLPYLIDTEVKLPYTIDDVYTRDYNPETIRALHSQLLDCQTCFGKDSTNEHVWEEEASKRKAIFDQVKKMETSVKSEHPFIAYFGAKVLPLSLFFGQDMFAKLYRQDIEFRFYAPQGFWDYFLRHIWNISYVFSLVFGFAGSLYAIWKGTLSLRILALICLSLLFVYPLIYNFTEWRYIVTALPFLLFMAMIFLKNLVKTTQSSFLFSKKQE
jgi:hypothetical protein